MRRAALTVLTALFLTSPLWACIWDRDTLAMETQRFPSTLELITGRFVRHSTAFYEWRRDDRLKKLKSAPDNLGYADDLAASYDKLGESERAVELMRKSLETDPKRYETLANLGTFLIHSGKLKEGMEFIDKAIEVNPDAHFGREIYQRHLVEYVLLDHAEREPLKLPLINSKKRGGFDTFLISKLRNTDGDAQARLTVEEVKEAVKGVLGMMRFGNFRSPVLLEALSDLLAMHRSYDVRNDASHLNARALLKASWEAEDQAAKDAYFHRASKAMGRHMRFHDDPSLFESEIVAGLKEEVKEGEAFFAEIEANEKKWIADGENPEVLFSRKYYGKNDE